MLYIPLITIFYNILVFYLFSLEDFYLKSRSFWFYFLLKTLVIDPIYVVKQNLGIFCVGFDILNLIGSGPHGLNLTIKDFSNIYSV